MIKRLREKIKEALRRLKSRDFWRAVLRALFGAWVAALSLVCVEPALSSPLYSLAIITRVIDGDTVDAVVSGDLPVLDVLSKDVEMGGDFYRPRRLRLIGIDCAPLRNVWITHGYGRVAAAVASDDLLGRQVWLEWDIEPLDSYGRELVYVWQASPDVMIEEMYNSKLLISGMAVVSRYPPNVRYSSFFSSFQRQAKMDERGVWGLERW